MKKSEIVKTRTTYTMNGLELRNIVWKHFLNSQIVPEDELLKINGSEIDGRDYVTFIMEIASPEMEDEDV